MEALQAEASGGKPGAGGSDLPLELSALALHSDGRAFKVTFEGEGAQDVGGPYHEAVDNICAELHSEALPLLARTPNHAQLNSLDRDRRMLNPAATSARALRMFELM